MTDAEENPPDGQAVRIVRPERLERAVRRELEMSAQSVHDDLDVADAAATVPNGRQRRRRGRGVSTKRPWWKELPILVGVALVLALVIKSFLVQAFSIPSGSMQNTLQKDDRVLVDKLTPWFGGIPQRGEVIVFRDPGGWLPERSPQETNAVLREIHKALTFVGLMPSVDEKDLIKRVIAIGGRVRLR